MSDEFSIIIVTQKAYELSNQEAMGSKSKFWFEHPELGFWGVKKKTVVLLINEIFWTDLFNPATDYPKTAPDDSRLLGEYKGKQELYKQQAPQVLETL